MQDKQQTLCAYHYQQCLDKLLLVQQAVLKKDWSSLTQTVQAYTLACQHMTGTCFDQKPRTTQQIEALKYLRQQQFRVMRALHTQQSQTQDDLTATHQGLRQIQHLISFVASQAPT